MNRLMMTLAIIVLASSANQAQATFLNLSAVVADSAGTFTGTLEGVSVSGAITAPNPNFFFTETGSTFNNSTINGTSPQFSYAGIYSPTEALTDRVGYNIGGGASPSTATITITFGSVVSGVIFQVANLDSMQYTFSLTGGLTGLQLLSGNGGGGDGIQVVGNVISDANQATVVGQDPTETPFTTGARSAYGSVALLGGFSSLTITVTNPTNGGDGGSFTLAIVPEPSTFALCASALFMGLIPVARRMRRKAA